MHPIISIVGRSKTGKTTLLEALIAELKSRGYRLATIKHSAEDVEFDKADKDTWRFTRAGSDLSAISSRSKLAVFKDLDYDFDPLDLARFICWDYDLILTEGFKKRGFPKIEVHRNGDELISPPEQLLAVVTGELLEVGVPQFSPRQVKEIASLVEEWLKHRPAARLDLVVNGEVVPLSEEQGEAISGALRAALSGIKGINEIKSLRLSLRRDLDI
ncbi:MAG: molybdopterin-guanine dinucleotide biosynthesis protein B [Chloroflexi bacterium]|nr:molybdopterin-guanine dinucleotide biosynthesis protein B [Chloroflexota bacterium]